MIYLDNNATTRPFPKVVDAMMEVMTFRYWNASSAYGQLDGLEGAVEAAKMNLRKLVGARIEDEVIFTSGATESNAWAVAEGARRIEGRGWILSSQIEHPSVGQAIERFQQQGGSLRLAPVTHEGALDLNKLSVLIDSDLEFATLILAHNETGVIQPLKEALNLIRIHSPKCLIHVDGTQAIGKIPISISDDLDEVDLLSFSGHKFHGPKGIGGLVVRNGISIQPLILGGGQQSGMRSGTLNVPSIVGLSVAASVCTEFLREGRHEQVATIRDMFEEDIRSIFPDALFLGKQSPRLPNTSFFGIPGTDGDDLVYALAAEGIAVSKGSACSTQSIEPSKTATLMGYSYEEASSLIRFAASFDTTPEEPQLLAEKLYNLCC